MHRDIFDVQYSFPVIRTLLKHLFMFNTDYLESVYKVHKSEKMNDFLY